MITTDVTYSFLVHIVFATKERLPLIQRNWEGELYKYLGGIIKIRDGDPLEINGMPDHTHILARLTLKEAFPDFMRELKASSSRWIRQHHDPKFQWQRRYGAFSVSESASDAVRKYIRGQKAHHGAQTFEGEYKTLLKRHRVDFDERYLWE